MLIKRVTEMEPLVCVVILFCTIGLCWCYACPDNSTILQDGVRSWCIWTINMQLPLYNMVETCLSSGWLLFSVPDQAVQDYLEGSLGQILQRQQITSEVWLNYNATSMGTFEGNALSYTNWNITGIETGECVTARFPDYLWTRTDCQEQHFGMCYKEIDCPVSGRYLPNYGLCFWVTTSYASPAASDLLCGQNGGKMAVFNDSDVMDVVTTNPVFSGFLGLYGPLWIGINDTSGTYLTMAGDPAPYLRWNSGEPDSISENCITVEWTLRMHDVYCSRTQVSLCFKWNTDAEDLPLVIIPPMTTAGVLHQSETTTSSYTSCCRLCGNNRTNTQSASEIDAQLLQLQSNTRVHLKNTTAYRKTLVCATDDRPSSIGIGMTAAAILITFLVLLIVADLRTFLGVCAK